MRHSDLEVLLVFRKLVILSWEFISNGIYFVKGDIRILYNGRLLEHFLKFFNLIATDGFVLTANVVVTGYPDSLKKKLFGLNRFLSFLYRVSQNPRSKWYQVIGKIGVIFRGQHICSCNLKTIGLIDFIFFRYQLKLSRSPGAT